MLCLRSNTVKTLAGGGARIISCPFTYHWEVFTPTAGVHHGSNVAPQDDGPEFGVTPLSAFCFVAPVLYSVSCWWSTARTSWPASSLCVEPMAPRSVVALKRGELVRRSSLTVDVTEILMV